MRTHLCIATLAVASTLTSLASPARADGPRQHHGLYLRVGLGPGLALGTAHPDAGPRGAVRGPAVSTELAVGVTVRPGLVVGAGTFPMIAIGPSYDGTDVGSHHVSATGPFVDYYVDPQRGLHVQGGVLLAAGYRGGTDAVGAAFGLGLGASVGVGYDRWVGRRLSVGALARVTHYRLGLSGDDAGADGTVALTAPSLLLTLTFNGRK